MYIVHTGRRQAEHHEPAINVEVGKEIAMDAPTPAADEPVPSRDSVSAWCCGDVGDVLLEVPLALMICNTDDGGTPLARTTPEWTWELPVTVQLAAAPRVAV